MTSRPRLAVREEHLGGQKVVFDDVLLEIANPETALIVQEEHYYGFGLGMAGLDFNAPGNAEHRYTYNGKEEVPDFGLGWLDCASADYHARQVDPALGRMWAVDPLAGKFAPVSPYNYALNNPLRVIDPTGMAAKFINSGNALVDAAWATTADGENKSHSFGGSGGEAPPDDLYFTTDGQLSHVETTGDAHDRVFVGGEFKGYAQGQWTAAFNGGGWDFDGGLTSFAPSGNRWADYVHAKSLAGAGKVHEAGKWMRRNIGGAGLYGGYTQMFGPIGVNLSGGVITDGNEIIPTLAPSIVFGTPSATGGSLGAMLFFKTDPTFILADTYGWGEALSFGIPGLAGSAFRGSSLEYLLPTFYGTRGQAPPQSKFVGAQLGTNGSPSASYSVGYTFKLGSVPYPNWFNR